MPKLTIRAFCYGWTNPNCTKALFIVKTFKANVEVNNETLSTGDKNSLLSCENIPLGPHHDSADDWNSHIDSPGDQHGD